MIVGSCEADEAFVIDQVGTERRLAVPEGGEFAVDDALIVLSDPMTVIDLATGRVRARVPTGGAAFEALAYEASLYLLIEDRIVEIDRNTWTVRSTIGLPSDRECMALYRDQLLLTSGGAEDVVIVSLKGAPSIRSAPLPSLSCDLMVDASRGVGYMPFETESAWGVLALTLDDFHEVSRLSIGESSVGWIGLDAVNDVLYAEVGSELIKIDVM